MSEVEEKSLKKKVLLEILGKQDPKNAFTVTYKLANASRNSGVRMCRNILLLNGYLHANFPLFSMGNATFLIFAKDVPMTPIKYAWEDIY